MVKILSTSLKKDYSALERPGFSKEAANCLILGSSSCSSELACEYSSESAAKRKTLITKSKNEHS